MGYELWSLVSRNALGEYATEAEALAAVRDEIVAGGDAYAAELGLAYLNSRGRTRVIAEGSDLVRRAQQAASPHAARATRRPRAAATERSA
jgi:hypothetical protein